MDESCSVRPRSGVPLGLLGMILIVAAVEARLGSSDRSIDHVRETWRVKASNVGGEAARSEILLLGDSLVEFGVLPRVISGRLDATSYNLALPGGGPHSSYYMLRQALAAGARPRTILVDFTPLQLASLSDREAVRRPLWPALADRRDLIDLATRLGEPDLAASTVVSKVLRSYWGRNLVRASILDALEGKVDLKGARDVAMTRWNLVENRGAFVIPAGGRSADLVPNANEVMIATQDPRLDGYVDRFLSLAQSRKIRVFCLIPPLSPEHQARADLAGAAASYNSYLTAKLVRYPCLTVIDARYSGYAPSVFCDHMHLNRRGATILSDDIALFLRDDRPNGPRWHFLPAFQDREVPAPVKDMNDALAALGTSLPDKAVQ